MKVFGISFDSVEDNKKFADKFDFNFPLLSDPDGSAGAEYRVLPAKARFTSRVTFIIDEKGVLRGIDDRVQVSSHGEDLIEMIEELME